MEKKNEVLIKFGVLNKNNRVYLESEMTRDRVWSKDGDGSYYSGTMLEHLNGVVWFNQIRPHGKGFEEPVKTTQLPPVVGVIGHPERVDSFLRDVSHVVNNFRMYESNLIGDVNVLKTPKGEMLKSLLESDPDSIVFRPRGTGEINENKEVTEYRIIAFDAINKQEDAF